MIRSFSEVFMGRKQVLWTPQRIVEWFSIQPERTVTWHQLKRWAHAYRYPEMWDRIQTYVHVNSTQNIDVETWKPMEGRPLFKISYGPRRSMIVTLLDRGY
jgi:hypothetical protein